jgi:hypothetical protein
MEADPKGMAADQKAAMEGDRKAAAEGERKQDDDSGA